MAATQKRFCSRACVNARGQVWRSRACRQCQAAFTAKEYRCFYCSPACGAAARQAKARARVEVGRDHPALRRALPALWGGALSTTAIAQQFGVSKNVVVGLAHRLCLPAQPSPIRRPAPGAPQSAPLGAPLGAPERAPLEAPVVARPAAPVPWPLALPPARVCQYPLNEARPWRFCEAPSADDSSYCPAHRALCWIKLRPERAA